MVYRPIVRVLTRNSDLFCRRILVNTKTQFTYYASQSLLQPKSSSASLSIKKILGAICCFGVSGGAYAYFTAPTKKRGDFAVVEISEPYLLANTPDIKPSRRVTGPATHLGMNMVLFQYQSCPFCCKVRTFLEYYGIPFDIVEVNPIKKQQLNFSSYKKVPILVVHDKENDITHQLNDSSVIVSILGTFLLNVNDRLQNVLKFYIPVSYKNEEGKEVVEVLNPYSIMYGESNQYGKTDEELYKEKKWRKWADQELVHVLSPNIYRSPEEALQTFKYFSKVGNWEKNFSTFERYLAIYVGATAMYFIGKKLKKKYGLKDDVRESLYDSCKLWMKNVGKSKFMGGNSPNLADLAVYGLLSSIEGCPAFQDLLTHTNIGPWFYNVKEATGKHHGFQELQARL